MWFDCVCPPRSIPFIKGPIQLTEYGNGSVAMGNFATMRRTVARAAQDLLHQEQLFQQQQQQQQLPAQLNVAFRASLKRPAVSDKIKLQLDEEADVRKEFTYEYVLTEPTQEDGATCKEPEVPKVSWPRPSLMREKSSAVADLRARSESPSANRVLVLKDIQQGQQMAVVKARPKPPPKPSLHDLQQAFQLKRNGLAHMMMMEDDQLSMDQQQRLSFAESLPESLAGFAATIVSEDGVSPCPFEPTVSPLISECDWPHNTTGTGSSPAPLPDLMSLASMTSGQLRSSAVHAASENLYMNAPMTEEADQSASVIEDHYLPMTSTKLVSARSPPPLPAANYHFEENAYVEMTDNGKIKTSPPGRNKGPSSVFAGVFDPSYRSPESPRYSEITDCPVTSRQQQQQQEEDQPHYEFIYKASSQAEPVYMEVPQSEEAEEKKSEADEEGEEEEEPEAVLERQTNSAMDTTAMEEGDELGEPLELIIAPPRHPRFSISDTFRPASYFLRLETIPSEENGHEDQNQGQSDDQSDTELVSPPPIPTSPPPMDHRPPAHHSRSQSLDTSQDYFQGRTSRNSVTSELSHVRPPSDLSRRRPLTIVRSLEDLLVDSNDDHLAALSVHSTSRTSAAFQGSTQSLASSIRNAESWQPLYENVSPTVGGGHVRQASRISIASNTSRRMSSSPAGSMHSSEHPPQPQQRPRLGSALSLNSNVSASSVSRSEQSAGAPYYYSDLLSKTQSTTPEAGQEEGNGSLRSSSSRSAQAQAAKQAYQHSMDRLRSAQRRPSPPESAGRLGSTSTLEACHQSAVQTPTSSGQFRSEPRQLLDTIRKQQQQQQQIQQQRAQTPDLLANHPEQESFYYSNVAGTASSRPAAVGEVMRRVRSLEGLLDEDPGRSMQRAEWTDQYQYNRSSVTSHASNGTNGSSNGHHPAETPRYARDPTRGATKTLPLSHVRSPQGSVGDFVGGEFSPWDEDQLWRDKLRRASIRHTRSMDMLDEIHHDHHNGNGKGPVADKAVEEEDCYERLLQYSATLERTKRGQTYLDGYTWDEMEQRFRKPGRTKPTIKDQQLPPATTTTTQSPAAQLQPSPSHPFLEDGLPPPAFEIDREKLRQWDLMSTAPVPAQPDNRAINKEGGRRPAVAHQSSSTNSSSEAARPAKQQKQEQPVDLTSRAHPVPSTPSQSAIQRPSPYHQSVHPPDLVRTPGKTIIVTTFFCFFHFVFFYFLSHLPRTGTKFFPVSFWLGLFFSLSLSCSQFLHNCVLCAWEKK